MNFATDLASVTHGIQLAVAPVFLLTAVSGMIDHPGYSRQQKDRGDGQLYAVSHGRKVGRKIHPDSAA